MDTIERATGAADDAVVNPSTSTTLADMVETRMARRVFLQGVLGSAAAAATMTSAEALAVGANGGGSTLTFKEVAHGSTPTHAVAPGYTAQVLIRWGDRVLADAPAFDPMRQSAATQMQQFGYNNDFQAFMPLPRGSKNADHGLLWLNHEYAEGHMMFPGIDPKTVAASLTREQVDVEIAAQGASIVEVMKRNGKWQVTFGPMNRRITSATEMRIAGPAAGTPRMRTNADPTGTKVWGMINNCSGGVTPWGTILTCEENIDFYFMGNTSGPETSNHKRYGVSGKANYGWGRFHDRFNLDKEPNTANGYGWIVEVDPYDPTFTPVKRTALGRFKHEAANTTLDPHGHVVVYLGDDQRFEYLYKFVSKDRYDASDRAANMRLLDEGTLYVAKFGDDGTVTWLPLVYGQGPLKEANGFTSQADVVIEARSAADLVGATPMDRPEDVDISPTTGKVYVVLTNNTQRKADRLDKANPRANNQYGQIIELIPALVGGIPDHGAVTATWDMFLLAGNPNRAEDGAKYGGPLSESGWLACPDNVCFDTKGRMWIASDQGTEQHKYGIGDGIWACDAEGPGRAVTKMFFRTPQGAEMCGPAFTPDCRTFFVAVQHPASDDPGSTFDKPSTRWPDFKPDMPPRPSVVVITKNDGGVIGG